MPRTSLFRLVLTAVAVELFASAAGAQSFRYELDSQAPLDADGWTYVQDGATLTFAAPGVTVASTKGYAEWMLRADTSKPALTTGWMAEVNPGRGWWVEARVRLLSAAGCGVFNGPGLWVDDGDTFVQLHFSADRVALSAPDSAQALLDTTDNFHVYRLQRLGGRHFQLLVNGAIAVDEPNLVVADNGKSIMFGDLGGCDAASATWDYVAYDTFGPETVAGDADGDGIDNQHDNCVLVANADQADADADGVGDLCDFCATDPLNDEDHDGLCANQDPCPTDPRNDSDKDGVCDTLECQPYMTRSPTFVPGQCPAICFCPMIGIDPIGGYGGGIDNFGGLGAFGGTANGGGGGTLSSGGTVSSGGKGGAVAAGGTLSSGGSATGGSPTGGSSGSMGGASGRGGTTATGGTGAVVAGAPSGAGNAGGGSAAGAGSESTTDHGGCACSVVGTRASAYRAWLLAAAACALGRIRRRRRWC